MSSYSMYAGSISTDIIGHNLKQFSIWLHNVSQFLRGNLVKYGTLADTKGTYLYIQNACIRVNCTEKDMNSKNTKFSSKAVAFT